MVGVGLHILLESYMLYATSKAISSVDVGSTNGKTYFVHALGLIVSLGVEASFFLQAPPPHRPGGPDDQPHEHDLPTDGPIEDSGESTNETAPAL